MDFKAIREALESGVYVPDAALRAAMGHVDRLEPLVVDLFGRLKAGVWLTPRQGRLFFYGVHVLGAAGNGRFWPVWREVLELPSYRHEELFGDNGATVLGTVTLRLIDGHEAELFDLLAALATSEDAFEALAQVASRLVWEGRLDRARFVAFLEAYERDARAPDGSLAWLGWLEAVLLLGLTNLAPALERVAAAERIQFYIEEDWRDARDRLAAAAEDFADEQRFLEMRIQPFDDPVDMLWWAKALETRDRGEFDNGAGQFDSTTTGPLNEFELDWLTNLLSSDQFDDAWGNVETVDGRLHALAAGPSPPDQTALISELWDGEQPEFDNPEQEALAVSLLRRHYASITDILTGGGRTTPVLLEAGDKHTGRFWAQAFSDVILSRERAWSPLIDHAKGRDWLAGILGLLRDDPEIGSRAVSAKERRKLLEQLPLAVQSIHDFWRYGDRQPVRVEKVGRNDPCPCGSGKKFKKCCGG